MIEAVYATLAADMALLALLGGNASDPRIYPEVAPQDTLAPFLVYRVSQDGSRDEILDDSTLQLSIYADTALLGEQIAYRLKTLLDIQDQFNPSAENEYIYWCKHVGGESFYEDNDGLRLYHRVLMFALKFKRKV